MSEYITIQVGQCGNQIGSELWPLALKEYGIQEPFQNNKSALKLNKDDAFTSFQSFFYIPSEHKKSTLNSLEDLKKCDVKARVILVDMETSVVARYKAGYWRNLFDDACIITNYSGSGNNWAEGYCHYGPKFEDHILCSINKAVEKCNSLHGFLLMFSVSGGTGSGLGTYILGLLQDHYPNIDRFVTCVYPIGTEDVITCPYNMALATKELINHASCVVPIENRTLLDIISRQAKNKHSLDTKNFIAKCKPFQDMNSIIVNLLLNLTSGSRFSGSLNIDLNEISTNMVPFPNLQFLAAGISPLTQSTDLAKTNKQIREEIFLQTCQKSNQLMRINVTGPKSIILGTTLMGRGDFNILDMRSYVQYLQKKSCFASWSARAMKIGLCDVPPIGHHAAMLSLFNTTSMSNLFTSVNSQLMKLYHRKAHIHHYLQVTGFDENFFKECSEVILNNVQSYQDIEKLKPLSVPRLVPTNSDRPLVYGTLLGGWAIGVYVLQILWDNMRVIMTNYQTYVLWYTLVTGFISFLVCYRLGPVTNKRTQSIIQWTIQFIGLMLIFRSSQFQEAAVGQIVILVITYNFPKSWVLKSKTYWKRKFPPKLKLLTNDEYYAQGVKHTATALHELRNYCSSPNCNQWETVLKLKDVKRFASFVEGNSHLTDSEILEYESVIHPTELTDDDGEDITSDED